MKRIKSVNGYAIYQAVNQRDEDNYNCTIGNFNIYMAADIKAYGLSSSYPDFEDVETLAEALEIANGSNHAIAEAVAEELTESTFIDADTVCKIEAMLDRGETVIQILGAKAEALEELACMMD